MNFVWFAIGIVNDLLFRFFRDGGDPLGFADGQVDVKPFQDLAGDAFVCMKENKIMDGQDGPIGWQCQDGVMYISGDMEESGYFSRLPLQIDQVKENMKNPSAGEGQKDLVDMDVIVRQHGFCCYGIEYFLNAEKTGVWFAVYEVDKDVEGG